MVPYTNRVITFTKLRSIFLLVTGIVFSAMTFKTVHADSLTVDTVNDELDAGDCSTMTVADLPGLDGMTSLRESICASNNTVAGAPHTIGFDIESGIQTITLTSKLPEITAQW